MADRDAGVSERAAWLSLLERYGFGLALASAVLWFVRVDIVVPMVTAHAKFLEDMSAAQRDIGAALREQTQILQDLRAGRLADQREVRPMP